jgi:hypothetical protein
MWPMCPSTHSSFQLTRHLLYMIHVPEDSCYRQANWTKEVSTSIYLTRAFFWYQRRLDP